MRFLDRPAQPARAEPAAIVTRNAEGEPVTDTLVLAEGTGNTHRAVIQLVRQNVNDLSEFGRVAFEMRPFTTGGGMQSREIAILNEPQATLLLTYMRNNEIVRGFKKRLVAAFFAMAKELREGRAVTGADTELVRAIIDTQGAMMRTLDRMTDVLDRMVSAHGPGVGGGAEPVRPGAEALTPRFDRTYRHHSEPLRSMFNRGEPLAGMETELNVRAETSDAELVPINEAVRLLAKEGEYVDRSLLSRWLSRHGLKRAKIGRCVMVHWPTVQAARRARRNGYEGYQKWR